MDLRLIDDLSKRLSEALPPGMQQLRTEVEEQFRNILSRGFERMNLVSREEFDAQAAVLARTREHLERLEQAIAELEQSGSN